LGLLLPACSGLQDISYLKLGLLDSKAPTVISAEGALSPRATQSLLVMRWRNSYTDISALASLEEVATDKPLLSGNKVTLLYDGPQTMAAMMDSIRNAKNHINLETYIFDQDAVGLAFADLLIARQREGVQVQVIYDGVGTIGTPQSFFDRMRESGVALLAFNPVNPLRLNGPWEPNHRDHRKILVVDGVVAYTGGVNISSTYANSSLFRSKSKRLDKVGWRDTHIKIEGPAVAALQWEFLSTWTHQQSPDLADRNFFPPLQSQGSKLIRVLASEPDGDQEIYRAYLLAIREAKKSIHITTAYFVPDAQILRALNQAAQRGVDVKIILPGVKESGVVFYAGQSFYAEMLASGVRIFELQVAVLHAKTAVIDQVWSTIGSANMDTRSFLHNNELNVVVFDPGFGVTMEGAFGEDLKQCTEVTTQVWEQRSLLDRTKQWVARRLGYWL
jgi:cardiolipin synthase